MKVTERHMMTTDEFVVEDEIIWDKFIDYISIMGMPKIHKNDDGKIYALDLLYHDGSTQTRFILTEMTDDDNKKLEEVLTHIGAKSP